MFLLVFENSYYGNSIYVINGNVNLKYNKINGRWNIILRNWIIIFFCVFIFFVLFMYWDRFVFRWYVGFNSFVKCCFN